MAPSLRQLVDSLHAPEVECIGKGKAHRPYEFGVKVSVATTAHRSKGGQFVTHIAALPGNPYDGHTLATVIPAMEDMIGNTIERLLADAGYRGHNAPTDYKFRVYTSGQKRRLTPQIKRELRRRAAIEPVIGHLKAEHRMGRNYLAHRAGDAVNAVLFSCLDGWSSRCLNFWRLRKQRPPLNGAENRKLHGRHLSVAVLRRRVLTGSPPAPERLFTASPYAQGHCSIEAASWCERPNPVGSYRAAIEHEYVHAACCEILDVSYRSLSLCATKGFLYGSKTVKLLHCNKMIAGWSCRSNQRSLG